MSTPVEGTRLVDHVGLVSWAELGEVLSRVSVSTADGVRYAIVHHAERVARLAAEPTIAADQSRHSLSRGELLAELRRRVCAIPAGSYAGDPGFSVAISRVLDVLRDGAPPLPPLTKVQYGLRSVSGHIVAPFADQAQAAGAAFTGDRVVCRRVAEWQDVGGPESVAEPSVGTGTTAEEVSGGSGHAERQEVRPAEATMDQDAEGTADQIERWAPRTAAVIRHRSGIVDLQRRHDALADEVARYQAAIEKALNELRPSIAGLNRTENINFHRHGLTRGRDVLAAALGDGEPMAEQDTCGHGAPTERRMCCDHPLARLLCTPCYERQQDGTDPIRCVHKADQMCSLGDGA